jgi:Mrp family chromosome partitioning ATPase
MSAGWVMQPRRRVATVELGHFWRAVARQWLLVALILAAAVASSAYLAYSPADEYQATTTVLVEPKDSSNLGNFGAVSYVLPELQVQLTSAAVTSAAAAALGPRLRDTPVGVGSTVEPGTGIMLITATSVDRSAVAPWSNAYAQALRDNQPPRSPLRLTIANPALPPEAPSGPARASTLVSGSVLGLIAAVLAALLADSLRRRRALAQEIRHRFGVPVLGQLPRRGRATRRRAGVSRNPDRRAPPPDAVEALMRVRASLQAHARLDAGTTFCVTSNGAGEGSSDLVRALAPALRAAGYPVTVIDADLRRHRMSAAGGEPRSALPDTGSERHPDCSSITGAQLLEMAQSESGRPHVAMHPSDAISIGLPVALRHVEKYASIGLIDCPPLSAPEASVAARMSSGVVVVLDRRQRRCLDVLDEALARLDESRAVTIGVVLTNGRSTS